MNSQKQAYKVIIADDEELFASLLANSLKSIDNIEVYKLVHDFEGLKEVVQSSFFDLLILDVNFRGQSSIEYLSQFGLDNKPFKTLCLTSHDNAFIEQEAYALGVDSFLDKSTKIDQLVTVITQVLRSDYKSGFEAKSKFEVDDEVFTKRQIQVMQALADYDSEVKVSSILNISIASLKSHKQNLFVKTGTKNEKMLLKYALKHKLIFNKGS